MTNLDAQQSNNQSTPQENAGQNPRIGRGALEPEKRLTCYPDSQQQLHQLWVLYDNRPLLTYCAHQTQKYPYFSPVSGPVSGLPLTTEAARPYPHHRGIFFGMDRIDAAGETGHGFWDGTTKGGQIISQGPAFAQENGQYKITENSAEFVDHCLWKRGTQDPIIEDRRRFTVNVLDSRRYILDVDILWRMLTEITMRKTNHGLFGVRCAPDIAPAPYGSGILENSEGRQGSWCDKSPGGRRANMEDGKSIKGVHGHPARWMAFYGRRAMLKEEVVEGIAMFCPSKAPHPAFENCPWFTRDYGNFSPMPMHWFDPEKPLVLPEGEEIRLRYRIVAFAGTPAEAGLDALWEDFDQAG